LSVADAEIEWAMSGQSLPGFEAIDAATGEILGETILTPSDDHCHAE